MFIAVIRADIYIEWSFSLKDKRQIRYKLRDKIKNRFSISVIEVDNQDSIKTLTFGLSGVAVSEYRAKELISSIEEFIIDNIDAELRNFEFDILKY